MRRIFSISLIFLLSFSLLAKYGDNKKKREINAVRAEGKIKIDGILNEKVWQSPGIDDFVQSDPLDGEKPTEKTVVWVAYDDKNLYVAARLYDSKPDKIAKRLGRRDDRVESDWFTFAVDPYLDRRSGFLFSVNPAGSRRDAVLYNDGWRDYTWDGVWYWATRVDNKGWTVEIKVPFNQLRFQKKDKYIWGVNFSRFIMRKHELDTFVWIPKEEMNLYVSRFAKLTGIEGIKPKMLAEITPYVVSDVTFSPKEEGNPFATGHSFYKNAGLDFKLGIKSNLTLTGTINPDFGQVEVDPAVINLTAYETYYEEKRPFFIEGASIFRFGRGGSTNNMNINWWNPQFFYSRRIGRPPQGEVSTDGYVKYPDRTTILGAGKITGKIGNGWNIGFLDAVTAREFADIDYKGERSAQEVEPFSNYSVFRIQKEFNQGRQALGFMTTSVLRNLKTEELQSVLTKRANVFGIDGWSFLDKKKTWVLTGWLGGSYVEGSKDAILDLQQSPQHYFQRPDATHLTLNENATSMSGWAGSVYFNKERGNTLFNIALRAISPGFEINDLGFQGMGDKINAQIVTGYIWYHPGKVFRNKIIGVGSARNYDFGGNKINDLYLLMVQGQLLNYWGGQILAGYSPRALDRDLTRGGPLAMSPSGEIVSAHFYSDSRKPFVLFLGGELTHDEYGNRRWSVNSHLRWKPRSNISISIGPEYSYRFGLAQWVDKINDPLMTVTYGARYIFGEITQHTLSSSIRINWTFTPKLSLQGYIQPFMAVGKYNRFKELAAPRTYDFNVYGENGSTISYEDDVYTVDPDGAGPASPFSFGNPDFNYKSLRGTVVLRWEFKPGSTMYLVWTQDKLDSTNPGDFNFRRDFSDMITAPGDNIFLLKISYRWGS